MSTGIDEAVEFGQRLVPWGFAAYRVKTPLHWWVWNGYLHTFLEARGCFIPVAQVKVGPSTWQAGPATEPMVDLALTAVDEFTAMPAHDDAAVDEFSGYDLAEAA